MNTTENVYCSYLLNGKNEIVYIFLHLTCEGLFTSRLRSFWYRMHFQKVNPNLVYLISGNCCSVSLSEKGFTNNIPLWQVFFTRIKSQNSERNGTAGNTERKLNWKWMNIHAVLSYLLNKLAWFAYHSTVSRIKHKNPSLQQDKQTCWNNWGRR